MGKKKKTIKVEVQETSYRRWRVDELNPRIIYIDFRCIRTTPFKSVDYGTRRLIKWNSPEHLQGLIDEYFASCYGVIYNPRTGMPFFDEDGRPRTGQVKPFTVSGLACYIHIDSASIRKYSNQQIDALGYPTPDEYIGPQYSEIIDEARKKIEAFAEERLYDRDGFNGGKFVLNCAFGWQDRLEAATIKNMKAQQKMKRAEFELKKELIDGGNGEEEAVTINIVRASKKNDEQGV